MIKEPPDQQKSAFQIVKKLQILGHTAYLAGGCVRDLIMRRSPEDYDIATSATPSQVEKIFKKSIPVGKQFGVIVVIHNGFQFEVATFRKDAEYQDGRHPESVSFSNPQMDAERRDFTVNGLFYDPQKKKVIDYVDGRSDIKHKVIRTIGKACERFNEDYLRILRAVRFAANLDFAIEPKTWKAIYEFRKKIHLVSQERIRDELVKMFTRSGAGRGLELLSESGLLKEILPEVEAMKGVKQSPKYHPEGDVFIHTRLLMDRLKNPSTSLAFGALLHDIAKPVTYEEKGDEIHFYNHAHIGAKMAREILTRLRFSNREIDDVVSSVENHMKFSNVRDMRIGKLKQFISRPNFEMELKLHWIDCMASHQNLDIYRFLKRKLQQFKIEELKPKPFINGYDLMHVGIKPGPIMKEILEEVYILQLEGKLRNKNSVLSWVKKKFLKKSDKSENK